MNRRIVHGVAVGWVGILALAGCSKSADATSCTGKTNPCSDSAGVRGTQTCNADGKTWGVCTTDAKTPVSTLPVDTSGSCAGKSQGCYDNAGVYGKQTCGADGKTWNTCVANAPVDTGPCAGKTEACTDTATGTTGTRSCNADGKTWGTCKPGGKAPDGKDKPPVDKPPVDKPTEPTGGTPAGGSQNCTALVDKSVATDAVNVADEITEAAGGSITPGVYVQTWMVHFRGVAKGAAEQTMTGSQTYEFGKGVGRSVQTLDGKEAVTSGFNFSVAGNQLTLVDGCASKETTTVRYTAKGRQLVIYDGDGEWARYFELQGAAAGTGKVTP
jgi:hypothetical protein